MSDPPPRRAPRWGLALLSPAVCALAAFALLRAPPSPGVDEPAIFAEGDRLAEEGVGAYRRWTRARREGAAPGEVARLRAQAQERLLAAEERYAFVLDRHRGPDGLVDPEFEGHEERVAALGPYLADLAREP